MSPSNAPKLPCDDRAPLPAVVGPPVAGRGYELQHQLDAGQLVEKLDGLPVELGGSALDEELHHLDHLLSGVGVRLETRRDTFTHRHGDRAHHDDRVERSAPCKMAAGRRQRLRPTSAGTV